MNAFAENPFFFFVDNAPPVFPVNAHKDVSKIIELSDVGCDPRMPITAFPQNVNRCCRDQARGIKSSCKNERWKWYCEETRYPGSKSCKERCLFKGQNPKENGKLRSVSTNNENRYQCQWQRQPTYQDYIDEEIRRKSANMEYTGNEKESPVKRSRTRHWDRKDEFYGIRPNIAGFDRDARLQYFPGKKCTLGNRYPLGLWKGSEYVGGYPEYDGLNYSEIDAENSERQYLLTNTGMNNLEKARLSPEQNYAEYFEEGEENSRDSSRSRREHWQQFSAVREASQIKQNCSRYNLKFPRNAKQCEKSNDPDCKMDNLSHGKTRSRTCSPPSDRRKRTRSFCKSIYENVDLMEGERDILIYQDCEEAPSNDDNSSSSLSKRERCKESVDSVDVPKEIGNFVDRAVDTDTLSNASKISNFSMITQCCSNAQILTATPVTDKAENNVVTCFWEFIPLDKDGDQECSKTETQDNKRQNTISGCKSYPPSKRAPSTKDCVESLKSKRFKNLDKDTKISKSLSKDVAKSLDIPAAAFNANSSGDSRLKRSSPESVKNRKKDEDKLHQETTVPSGSSVMQRVTKTNPIVGRKISVAPKPSAATKCQKNSEVSINSNSPAQNQSAPVEKSQRKLKNILGSIEKANRLWKPHSGKKSESSGEKKKKTPPMDSSTSASDKTIGARIIEKMTANSNLKRKHENPNAEEISAAASQHSATGKEKKPRSDDPTYSKLPIRIGTRLRSKYPLAMTSWNGDKNTDAVSYQEGNDTFQHSEENLDTQRESVRSRTKPKIKPTLRQEEIPSIQHKSEYLKSTEKMTVPSPESMSDFNKNREEASTLLGNSKFSEPETEIRNSKSESRNDENAREACVGKNTINSKVLATDCDHKKKLKNSRNASPNHFRARTRERNLKTNEHRFYSDYNEPKMNYGDYYADEDQRNASDFRSRKYISVSPRF